MTTVSPLPASSGVSTLALWSQLNDALRRRLLARVNDPELIDDVLQDTFLKIHVRIDELETIERLDGWVYRVAHNALLDRLRYARVRDHASADDVEGSLPESPSDNFNHEVAGWLRDFIEVLPDTYREAVYLHEIEGLTQREVAERLGLTLSGAKSRIQRGRAKLRALLLDCCHVTFDRFGNAVDVQAREGCDQ